MLYYVQCTLCCTNTVHTMVYCVQYTLCCTVYSAHYVVLCTVHSMLCCLQCTLCCTVYSAHYVVLCTLHTAQYTQCIAVPRLQQTVPAENPVVKLNFKTSLLTILGEISVLQTGTVKSQNSMQLNCSRYISPLNFALFPRYCFSVFCKKFTLQMVVAKRMIE